MRGVCADYGEALVLDDVHCRIKQASLVAIVGPNGAGKSTLLKSILGIIPIRSGDISLFGGDVARYLHRIAYVPQRAEVDWDFPAHAVDIVAMGMHRRIGWCRPVRKRHYRQACEYLARVGLEDCASQPIGDLSGGQQQRVFLARALAEEADVYLMDEPLAGIDASSERQVIDIFRQLRQAGKSVICVHHDLNTLRDYFEQVIFLNRTVMAYGSVEDVFLPDIVAKTYQGTVPHENIVMTAGR